MPESKTIDRSIDQNRGERTSSGNIHAVGGIRSSAILFRAPFAMIMRTFITTDVDERVGLDQFRRFIREFDGFRDWLKSLTAHVFQALEVSNVFRSIAGFLFCFRCHESIEDLIRRIEDHKHSSTQQRHHSSIDLHKNLIYLWWTSQIYYSVWIVEWRSASDYTCSPDWSVCANPLRWPNDEKTLVHCWTSSFRRWAWRTHSIRLCSLLVANGLRRADETKWNSH